jgi:hypothetical protein
VVKGTLGELIEHIVGKHHCSFAEYHPLTMVRLKTLRPPNRSASNPNGILPRLPSSTGMAHGDTGLNRRKMKLPLQHRHHGGNRAKNSKTQRESSCAKNQLHRV